MARNKKNEEEAEVQNPEVVDQNNQETKPNEAPAPENEEQSNEEKEDSKSEAKEKIAEDKEPSARVLELMRLNPHYEEIWITPKGFVHPKKAAPHLIKGATLYKNKYYNKNK